MRQAIHLFLERIVQFFLAMAMDIAPQRGHAVQIFPAMIVDQVMTVSAADNHRVFAHPFLHLRERMPEVSMVKPFQLVGVGGHSRLISSKTFNALSICPSLWVAITVMRKRDVPTGTVGGRMPWANTPRSSKTPDNAMQRAASPTISGKIGLSLFPNSNPSLLSPNFNFWQLSRSASRRCGSFCISSMAANAIAITAGGSEVVKMKLRQRLISKSHNPRLPATYAPKPPSALPSVPICTNTRDDKSNL